MPAVRDAGAIIAWPQRFHEDELSAIQHAINLKLRDEAAFFTEYQNEPIVEAEGEEMLDVQLVEADRHPAGEYWTVLAEDLKEMLGPSELSIGVFEDDWTPLLTQLQMSNLSKLAETLDRLAEKALRRRSRVEVMWEKSDQHGGKHVVPSRVQSPGKNRDSWLAPGGSRAYNDNLVPICVTRETQP